MSELFKVIPDYPNYEVSNLGRVRNVKYRRFLTLIRTNRGWVMVGLSKDRKQRMIPVANLVAEIFLDPPKPPNTSILHMDGDRSNNSVENLVWKPRWYVNIYMRDVQTQGLKILTNPYYYP